MPAQPVGIPAVPCTSEWCRLQAAWPSSQALRRIMRSEVPPAVGMSMLSMHSHVQAACPAAAEGPLALNCRQPQCHNHMRPSLCLVNADCCAFLNAEQDELGGNGLVTVRPMLNQPSLHADGLRHSLQADGLRHAWPSSKPQELHHEHSKSSLARAS